MLHLPNNCKCSDISIHPNNWDKAGASVKVHWYIQFYFHDPNFVDKYPRGKFIIMKGGVNRFHTLQERRLAIKLLLDTIKTELIENGYNPITKTYSNKSLSHDEISGDSYFIDALEYSITRLKVTENTIKNIQSAMVRIKRAVQTLKFVSTKISDVKRKHLRLLFDEMGNQTIKGTNEKLPWTANTFNHYRTYMMMMFTELVELDIVEDNPVLLLKKKKIDKKYRRTLLPAERTRIDQHFFKTNKYYHRFLHIFFHSGSRPIELLRMKPSDVNLQNGTFRVTVRKGAYVHEDVRPIKNIIKHMWVELVKEANGCEYLFGSCLKPGNTQCPRSYVTKKWIKEVKVKLKIDVDFYSLKHLNLDETASLLSLKDASAMAGHTSTVITMSHYTFGEKERQNERLKLVDNSFAS